MKILRLDLRAFGPFTDVALDLSAGAEGLHLIYGPNEAGKSSALRAIRAMLYGIPNQTPDNFRHDYNKLTVGGTLRAADGRELPFLRLKRQNNPLRQEDGQTALDDAALDPFLQGVSESQFRTLFGLDHDELIQGGRTVLEGKNDLGQLLFAAGTGLAAARKIQDALQNEHEALFKPTGRNPPINRAITEYRAARDAAGKAMLPSATWEDHDRRLHVAEAQRNALNAQLAEARRVHRRLGRIQQAAPLLAERRLKLEQLAALGPVPHLADDFHARWHEAETGLVLAKRAAVEAEVEASEIGERRDAVVVPHDLLAMAEAIDPLRDALARYQADRQNRPARVVARDRAHDEATRRLLDLGLDPAQPPRLTRAQRDAIRTLAQVLPALRQEWNRAARQGNELMAERRRLDAERAALPDARDPAALALALDRARAAGDLDGRLLAVDTAMEQITKQIARDAERLGHWAGPVERLDALPLPPVTAIDAADDTLRALDDTLRETTRQTTEARRQAEDAEEAIRQLRLAGDVPSEADLHALRTHREALWERLRGHWLDGVPVDSPADRMGEYARAVSQADDLADRLRREADRVAQLVQHESRRAQFERQASVLNAQADEAHAQRDASWKAWNALWTPAGITPDSPRAMREWLTQRVEPLRAKLATREQQRDEHRAVARHREALRGDLHAALTTLGEPAPGVGASLAAMCDAALATLQRLRENTLHRERLDRDQRRLDDDLETTREQTTTARDALAAQEGRWAEAVAPLGLGAEATPEQAMGAVESLTEAIQHREEAQAIDREITEIDRATSGFVARVKALASRVDPPPTAPEPESIAQALLTRLAEARKQAAEVEALGERLSRAQEKAQRARETAGRHEVTREALVREAGGQHPEDIPGVLACVDQARPLREAIANVERNLLLSGRGATLAEIADEVASVPPDELDSRLAQVDSEIATLETDLAEQQQIIGAQQNELERMDGRDDAAEAASRASAIAAQLTSQVDQYVRLRLAEALLKQGMERHRQRNQGPILGRAGDHFARLTRGSFAGLQVAEGPKGEPTLVGVRPGGATVAVDGLSEGTADALYLSLRLAGLEAHLDAHPPMPLIVDDILIQFDDDRALASLEALAALSQRTQVLLFTHHRRLVDLAATLDPAVRFLHELPGRVL